MWDELSTVTQEDNEGWIKCSQCYMLFMLNMLKFILLYSQGPEIVEKVEK